MIVYKEKNSSHTPSLKKLNCLNLLAGKKIPKKSTMFIFKAKDGTTHKGVTIKLATGENFVSDNAGTITIYNYNGTSGAIDIVSMELAA